MFNSFAKKKKKNPCINIKSQVSWAWVGESRRSRKFPSKSFPERKHACIQIVLMVYLIHTEVIKANIDLHMDMLPGNMKILGDEEIC